MTTARETIGNICELTTVIGALNWGLIGAFNFNLVRYLFGNYPVLENFVYGFVGIAGLYILYRLTQRIVYTSNL